VGNKPLKSLDSGETVKRYASLCCMFLLFCIDVVLETHPALPPCPINRVAKELLLDMDLCINDEKDVPLDSVGAALAALFIQTNSYHRPDNSFHVLQFVTLRMMKREGSFHDHSLVTRLISPLQYCVRMAFLYLYLDCTPEGGGAPVTPTAQRILTDMLGGDVEAIWNYSIEKKGINSPFWVMRGWQHLMASVTMYEGLPDTTFWVDSRCSQILVDGHRVVMSDVRGAIQKTFNQVALLLKSLTRGVTIPEFEFVNYDDNSANSTPGYNYLQGSSVFHKRQFGDEFLLTNWLRSGDPQGFRKPTNGNEPGEWDEKKIRLWLDEVDELTHALYFCFHCGCGQPARGTEEEVLKIVNTQEAPRNLFLRGDRFMVQTSYHKSQSISRHGKNRMVYLPPWLSQHLHTYLAFVRPAQM
jgi:hypothetical protein